MKNKSDSNPLQQLFGLVMAFVAVVILLLNIDVTSFGFYHIGRVSTAPVLIVALVLLVIWAVVSSSKLAWGLAAADVLMIVISVLMGTRFYLRHMSALTLIVIVLMFAIGVGLIIAGGVGKRK
ncbi:MAG: hypothetical protein E7426_01465 [Ruminococcaceae bacterium]|nr:hypothetical protein [Oscillospiraceae bacterium]